MHRFELSRLVLPLRAWRVWWGAAMALLCIGGQLSLSLHYLLVPHVACAQHGEVEHVQFDSDDAQSGATVARERGPERRATAAGEVSDAPSYTHSQRGEAHGHEACCLAFHAAQPPAPSAAPVLMASQWAVASFSDTGSDVVQAKLTLLAPKTSPPA